MLNNASELSNYVVLVVVGVGPEFRIAEVWIVYELSASLGPANRLHLCMSPEVSWIKRKIVEDHVKQCAVKAEPPAPPNSHFI